MGKYIDKKLIGSGGFGEVYSLKRKSDGKVFAKKILVASSPDAIKRFGREVRLLNTLDHPNIVKIVGKRLEKAPDFYVMPRFKNSLKALFASQKFDIEKIDDIFSRILAGMEYAHSQGVIHRDLKSANILLNSETDVVVSDFGLGRRFDAESTRLTTMGRSLGTQLYAAPEQIDDASNADERSDIFSLGRLLTELFTGPLSTAIPDFDNVPSTVQIIIRRCTKRDPDERFQSVSELRDAWTQFGSARAESQSQEDYDSLLESVTLPEQIDQDDAVRFFEILDARRSDGDLVHEAIMAINFDAITAAGGNQNETLKSLLITFSKFTADKSFGFDHTDSIARRIKTIFGLIDDPEVRAYLAFCCGDVGASHNRWFVMNKFADMIVLDNTIDFAVHLAEILREMRPHRRKLLAKYVNHKTLRAELKPMLKEDS